MTAGRKTFRMSFLLQINNSRRGLPVHTACFTLENDYNPTLHVSTEACRHITASYPSSAEENCSNETLRAEPGLRLISVHGGKGGYEKLIYQLGYSKGTAIGQQCSILILGEKVVGFLKIYNL